MYLADVIVICRRRRNDSLAPEPMSCCAGHSNGEPSFRRLSALDSDLAATPPDAHWRQSVATKLRESPFLDAVAASRLEEEAVRLAQFASPRSKSVPRRESCNARMRLQDSISLPRSQVKMLTPHGRDYSRQSISKASDMWGATADTSDERRSPASKQPSTRARSLYLSAPEDGPHVLPVSAESKISREELLRLLVGPSSDEPAEGRQATEMHTVGDLLKRIRRPTSNAVTATSWGMDSAKQDKVKQGKVNQDEVKQDEAALCLPSSTEAPIPPSIDRIRGFDLALGLLGACFILLATGAGAWAWQTRVWWSSGRQRVGGLFVAPGYEGGSWAGTRFVTDALGSISGPNVTVVGSDDGERFWVLRGALDVSTGRIDLAHTPHDTSSGKGMVTRTGIVWEDGHVWTRVAQAPLAGTVESGGVEGPSGGPSFWAMGSNLDGVYNDFKYVSGSSGMRPIAYPGFWSYDDHKEYGQEGGTIRAIAVSEDGEITVVGSDSPDFFFLAKGQWLDKRTGKLQVDYDFRAAGTHHLRETCRGTYDENAAVLQWEDGARYFVPLSAAQFPSSHVHMP